MSAAVIFLAPSFIGAGFGLVPLTPLAPRPPMETWPDADRAAGRAGAGFLAAAAAAGAKRSPPPPSSSSSSSPHPSSDAGVFLDE